MNSAQTVRVHALKGFYAYVGGQFGVVNPGDVVELDRVVAPMVIATHKAEHSTASLRRDPKYLPERKRNPRPSTEDLLASLVKATEANTLAISALVSSQKGKAKD